jgi:hypothetical protein
LDVSIDSTSPLTFVLLSTGNCFIDDVFIQITDEIRIDFEYEDHYFSNPFNEEGYYYLILEYQYLKAKPAPQAKLRIIKPSEIAYYSPDSPYLFLKAIKVEFIGGIFQIISVHDYDPDNPENRRIYSLVFEQFDEMHLVTSSEASTRQVTVPFAYAIGFNKLKVFVNGILKSVVTTFSGINYGDYVETNSTTITFEDGVINEKDIIRFIV